MTIDAHKWLSVPMGAGMFFARDAGAVARAFAVTTGYMPAGDGADAYITTSQWSRRFLGLRLWMMLRATGTHAYSQMFTRHFELAAYTRRRLVELGWQIHNNSELPVILFGDAGGASDPGSWRTRWKRTAAPGSAASSTRDERSCAPA